VSVRVARSRAVVAAGYRPAVVARVAGVSRQALYRPLNRRPATTGPGRGRPGDEAIVEVAKAHPTDGTRMVAALASRQLGEPVNRKRVQRVMRAHRLLQRSRNTDRRRRPGFFRVTRPDELWHIDMTKVWTAQHGWVYLHAIVDCCTRELVGWSVDLRCRDDEAIAVVEAAVVARRVQPGQLTLGSDNGSQGGFNRSSQHLDLGGVDGQADSVDESAYWTGADEVPRGAAASAGSGARVLG
jgi:putative transposase